MDFNVGGYHKNRVWILIQKLDTDYKLNKNF